MKLRTIAWIGLLLVAGPAIVEQETARAASPVLTAQARPNVLFIMADDLNDDMGVFGHPIVKTPNLDRLAARGVRFERAYTQFALCNPSRASYMTGLRPDTIRVYNLTTHFREAVPNAVTLPQMFMRAGYYSARIGKIYHYGNPGDIGTSGLDDPPSWNHIVNPRGIDKDEEPKLSFSGPSRALGSSLSYYASPAPDERHTDGLVASETIALLEKNRDRPFFIAAGFYRPHCPYIAPQKYFDMYPDLSRIPVSEYSEAILKMSPTAARGISWNVPEQEQREAIRAYYASITFMDAQVGRLLDALERLKLADNTIVVFMSDHGYHTGDHGGLWMKQSLFERSVRTPLIMAGPGVTAHGQASNRVIELLDIYPTLADLGRVAPPAGLEGRSLRPLLSSPRAEWPHAALSQTVRPVTAGRAGGPARAGGPGAAGATTPQAPSQPAAPPATGYSVRTERWRYIEWDEGRLGQELYDELSDPGEVRNLAREPFYASAVAEMKGRLTAIRARRN
jgi:uncharacterized sulfatase